MWKFIPTVVQPIQGDIGGIIRLLLIEKYSSASSVNFKCAAADVPESLKTFAPFFNLLKVSVKKKSRYNPPNYASSFFPFTEGSPQIGLTVYVQILYCSRCLTKLLVESKKPYHETCCYNIFSQVLWWKV